MTNIAASQGLEEDRSFGGEHQHQQNAVTLNNLIEGTSAKDTLHTSALNVSVCTGQACGGALIDPLAGVSESTSAQKMGEAKDFFRQYYESMNSAGSTEHLARLAEAEHGLNTTGVYTHTLQELEFATKTAWRNAARCIGRIQWKNLKVVDARNAKTASHMFESLMEHLKYATNGGNLRSTITIFPPKSDGRQFRCFNPQLVQYAGYRQGDQVIGDPINVDLTRLLQRLGWKGRGGPFDVLPLLLQAAGQDPEWFEIPPELVLEVDIVHPHLDWFQELGIRWYAVPAVAGMRLDCGGLEYTGCPFNGWYMGTEVGARDLCDEQRYNMLPAIARRMGLDTERPSTLWKDRALLEMNVAVLHSYQAARVTIIDHHSASQSFMQHHALETAARGGCPADWVWIVPPMSGSVCPVFHQEMVKYTMKPSYEYQVTPWVYDVYGRPCLQSQLQQMNTQKVRLTFSILVRCTMALLALRKESRNSSTRCPRVTIVYATETGRSLIFSKQIAKTLRRNGCVPKVVCMSDYALSMLEEERHLLVVTSTFGSGESPENGRKLWSALKKMENADLSKLKYTVLALGSTLYREFCKFGKDIDEFLTSRGATAICPLQEADEMRGQDSAYKKWAGRVLQYYTKGDFGAKVQEEKVLRYRFVSNEQTTPTQEVLGNLHGAAIKLVAVETVRELQANGTTPKYFNAQFSDKHNETPDFKAGDHLQIHPANSEENVQMVLSRLDISADQHTLPLQLEVFNAQTKQWIPDERFPGPMSLHQMLTWFLDMISPANDDFIQELTEVTKKITNNGSQKVDRNTPKNGDADDAIPAGLSNGVSNGFPNDVSSVIANHASHNRASDVSNCMSNDISNVMSNDISNGMSNDMSNGVSKGMSNGISNGMSNGVSNSMSNGVSNGMCNGLFNGISNGVSMAGSDVSLALVNGDVAASERPSDEMPLTYLEIIQLSKPQSIPVELLLSHIATTKPRRYSLSSPPLYQKKSLYEVTFKEIVYSRNGTQYKGLATGFMSGLEENNTIYVSISSAPNFRVSMAGTKPVLMIAQGTGIAPFRSFWRHKLEQKKTGAERAGPLHLFYGCRNPDVDFLYKEEIVAMKSRDILDTVTMAFSRDKNTPKTYVQHLLIQNAEQVGRIIHEQDGYIFYCGDIGNWDEICVLLIDVLQQHTQMSLEDARRYLAQMKNDDRLTRDIFME